MYRSKIIVDGVYHDILHTPYHSNSINFSTVNPAPSRIASNLTCVMEQLPVQRDYLVS